jgi:hypothetical protein
MIKIGIVNIANYNYNFKSLVPLFHLDGVEILDYCDTVASKHTNFYRAIGSDELDFVWFLSGGTLAIDIMDRVYSPHPKSKKTRLIGASDATHAFIYFMNQPMIEKYYYLNLLDFIKLDNAYTSRIRKLFLDPVSFDAKTREISNLDSNLLIIGGHSVISAVHLGKAKLLDGQKVAYFWEHHGAKLESKKYYLYWLKVLVRECNRYGIEDIIFGRSEVHDDKTGIFLNFDEQKKVVKSEFDRTNINMVFIDQSVYPLRLY